MVGERRRQDERSRSKRRVWEAIGTVQNCRARRKRVLEGERKAARRARAISGTGGGFYEVEKAVILSCTLCIAS